MTPRLFNRAFERYKARVTNKAYRFATVQGKNIQWFLRRRHAITATQLSWFFALLCAISVAFAVLFWVKNAGPVMFYTGVPLLLVGVGIWLYARHAGDGERIYLAGANLVVELQNAGKLVRAEFRRDWVRIEPTSGDRSLIEVSAQGRSINVGRFIRPELRPVLANELRMALRGA